MFSQKLSQTILWHYYFVLIAISEIRTHCQKESLRKSINEKKVTEDVVLVHRRKRSKILEGLIQFLADKFPFFLKKSVLDGRKSRS